MPSELKKHTRTVLLQRIIYTRVKVFIKNALKHLRAAVSFSNYGRPEIDCVNYQKATEAQIQFLIKFTCYMQTHL